ncbi:MAG TPA: PQQ-binding-like beta-propeller repeat protein [Vicinamibacteria bacterium]
MKHAVLTLAAAAVIVPASLHAEPATWAQWRGPDGQGVSQESGLPSEWGESAGVRWKTPIPGRGHSQPIVWGDRIFLTTDIEGDEVAGAKAQARHLIDGKDFVHPDGVGADRKHTYEVLALDAKSGKVLWERVAWEGVPYDTRHKRGAYAAATPVSDGKMVWAYFGSEGLYAYDFDGKQVWKAALGGIATMGVGIGTSPVLHENVLIVQADEDNGDKSFIVGFDKKTGKELWRTPRAVQVSWATPVLVKAAGRDELVTSGTEWVIAYDPRTGKELWKAKGLDSNAVPSPVVAGDLVILSAGYPAKLAMAIRAGGSGDVTESRVVWKFTKGTAYVPSPIAYQGHVYLVTDKGLLTCLDAKTGEVKYEGGRVPVPATFMASPVAYDGKILLLSEDGDGFLIKAGAVHEILKTNSLKEPVHASPAIAGGSLYIRGEKHLYRISKS